MRSRETVFIDSSAWYALADRKDGHHKRAGSIIPSLLKTAATLVTSNLVIAESHVLILHALGHDAAMDFLERLRTSTRLTKVYSDPDMELEAEKILARYSDQDFSYADAVSFAIMKQMKVKKAFCFDKHFLTAGFIMIPAHG